MLMLYFSGTGNSKYIAELFCNVINTHLSQSASAGLPSQCFSIEEMIDFEQLISSHEIIGFCYPIYGSRVPRVMREFVKKYFNFLKEKKVIIFCTQWIFSGDGARVFTDMFPRNFIKVIYAEHFLMPKWEKKALDLVRVYNDCTQCGLCVSICPMRNFENRNGKIIVKGNCTICYRCINKCPQKAIAVFLKTKVRKQYMGLR